jgi:hypothetical protein
MHAKICRSIGAKGELTNRYSKRSILGRRPGYRWIGKPHYDSTQPHQGFVQRPVALGEVEAADGHRTGLDQGQEPQASRL